MIDGAVRVDGDPLDPGTLLYLGTGRHGLELGCEQDTRALLIGGTPFEEELVMWWNFVARSHAEIAEARTAWEQASTATRRYGSVAGHDGARIPAPPLPNVRLTPRRRRSG